MGGGGGRINKPKTSKLSTRTRARQKTKSHKHKYIRSEDTLSLTTDSVLRQCRTNPKANVKISSKKKRLLLRDLKTLAVEKCTMETEIQPASTRDQKLTSTSNNKMDTT